MKVGISTYAYRWEYSEKAENPISLEEMLERTSEYGANVFQICDFPLIETYTKENLSELKKKADTLNIELELGTQGIDLDHLRKFLFIARYLNVKVLRTTLHSSNHVPSISEAISLLEQVVTEFEQANVKIALETYEPIKATDLIKIVEEINNPFIGICLDPGNTISELEFPNDVIHDTRNYVTNLHVKDFIFKRGEGAVGFELTGCPLGEGQLDIDFMLDTLFKSNVSVNAIIELWLPFTENLEKTSEIQDKWLIESVKFLKSKIKEHS